MRTETIAGIITFVVDESDSEHGAAAFVSSLKDNHPDYPFGIACEGSASSVLNSDEDLAAYIEGWCEGMSLDA